MIPRHRPPFGLATLAGAVIPRFGLHKTEQLEQAYANAINAPHAVWLPSARYGIFQAINAALGLKDQVYCPAFTCPVVHQAVRQTARPMTLVDCNANDPLMQTNGIRNHNEYGVVLSEVFGIRYHNPAANAFLRGAGLRIFDMAMCIPTQQDIQRLVDSDVALISFGLGKSLYAGWGGMAFTKDRHMAESLRRCRDQDIRSDSTSAGIRKLAIVWLRTAAHSQPLYKFSRRAVSTQTEVAAESDRQISYASVPEKLQTSEWHQAPTAFHLNLAAANLKQSSNFEQDRITYSNIYRNALTQLAHSASVNDAVLLTLPPKCNDAMSHFSVRVGGNLRDELRTFLWQNDIDTATLFPFPVGAESAEFPNAFRLTQEVLGLPLSNGLGEHNIRRICSLISRLADAHTISLQQPQLTQLDRRAA
jgi:dTDP-4-amino-4,6-dideoxygalactose transaminase